MSLKSDPKSATEETMKLLIKCTCHARALSGLPNALIFNFMNNLRHASDVAVPSQFNRANQTRSKSAARTNGCLVVFFKEEKSNTEVKTSYSSAVTVGHLGE